MELYLLRHGIAEERHGGGDSQRALTAAGIADLGVTLQLAHTARVRPSLVLASPYIRARQTAEIAAKALEYRGQIVSSPAFAPDSSPFRLWQEIRLHEEEDSILIAAHEPLLSSAVAWFAGSARELIHFSPATMIRVDFPALGLHPDGVMRWMICPELRPH